MRKLLVTIIFFTGVYLMSSIAQAQVSRDFIKGIWFNEEKDGKIEIYEEGGKFFGKLIWAENPRKDDKNPDEKLREREVVGIKLLNGFTFKKDDDEWNDGTIYDPKNGKTYSCLIRKENDETLYVRGFIGFSLIGRTTYWTKAE